MHHDSALSVGSSKEDAAKIKSLEEEVTVLADKANAACMYLDGTCQGCSSYADWFPSTAVCGL